MGNLKLYTKYKRLIVIIFLLFGLSGCVNSWTGRDIDDVIEDQNNRIESKFGLNPDSFSFFTTEYYCWEVRLDCFVPYSQSSIIATTGGPLLYYTYFPEREQTRYNKTYYGQVSPKHKLEEEDLIYAMLIDFVYNDLPFEQEYGNNLDEVFKLIDDLDLSYAVVDRSFTGSCLARDSEEVEYIIKQGRKIGVSNITSEDFTEMMLETGCRANFEMNIYDFSLPSEKVAQFSEQLYQQAKQYYNSDLLHVSIQEVLYRDNGKVWSDHKYVDEHGVFDVYEISDFENRKYKNVDV